MKPNNLLANLKRLGIRDAIVRDYLGGFPTRPGQQPKITPKFTSAQLAIAKALAVRFRKSYGWAPPPKQGTGSVLVVAHKGIILADPKGKPATRPDKVHPHPVSRITLSDAFSFTFANEGRVPHMYADSEGVVTVGIGHAIFRPQDAHRLPFVRKDTGAPATREEIDKDFEAVEGITNHVADFFADLTALELSSGEIDALLHSDFDTHLDIADDFFPLEKLPQPMQIALFDLAFQVGTNLTLNEYSNLHPALRRRDWARAGAEMDVNQPSTPVRNAARLAKSQEGLAFDFYFTIAPAKLETLLDHLMKL